MAQYNESKFYITTICILPKDSQTFEVFIVCMQNILPPAENKEATLTFRHFLDFRMRVDMYRHNKVTLKDLKNSLSNFQKHFNVFLPVADSAFKYIKLHMLTHYAVQIEEYGSPRGTTTNLGEMLHKTYIKEAYKMTNRREPEIQVQNFLFSAIL